MILKNYYKILGGIAMQTSSSPDENQTYIDYNGKLTKTSMAPNSNYGSALFGYSSNSVNPNMGRCITSYTTTTGGVIFGDGDTPVTIDDYKLSGNIVSGFAYSASVSATFDDDGASITGIYTITNSGTADITIKEVGLYSRVNVSALLERTVLDSPVTIPVGGIGVVTYTIKLNYPTA